MTAACVPTEPLPVFAAILDQPDPPPFTAADAHGPPCLLYTSPSPRD